MTASKWKNTVAFFVMIAVNAIANLLPLGGNTTGDVSATHPNLFTSAPITFAIRGMRKEFREQIADPSFEGFCRCKLFRVVR